MPARSISRFRPFGPAALWAALLIGASGGWAATITVINLDGPGEGFNDPTPVAPEGGNPGVTIGEQRWIVFQHAAEIWGAKLDSPITIVVHAQFDPLDCSPSSGTLGSAGPFTFFRDFAGAPLAGTYYPVALANALARRDLDPSNPDVVATFNSSVGSSACLSTARWYYGLDGQAPSGSFNLFGTVLHELAHGLGFTTIVNKSTGAKPNGYNDAFMRNLEDHSTGKVFPNMSDAERVVAMTDDGDLHWIGSGVVGQSGILTGGRDASGHVQMYAPGQLDVGSSVSHFDTRLYPDELMEPFANSRQDRRLTTALFQDIGWSILPDNPVITTAGVTLLEEDCPPGNLAVDPGERVTLGFHLQNTGTGLTGDLRATLLPSAGVGFPSGSQSYGVLPAGGGDRAQPFSFLASGTCGGTVVATFQLRDDTNDLGTVSFNLRLGNVPTVTRSFTNATALAIPASGRSGPANPYPSALSVSGVTAPVGKVTVTVRNLSHAFPDDLDMLLVGPGGQKVLLMSDAGGSSSLLGVTLTFDDEGERSLPDSGSIASGVYRPTNYGSGDAFSAPAPAPPYQTALGVFRNLDPNGTWNLFVMDDSNPNTGALAGGWTLQLVSELEPTCCDAGSNLADLALSAQAQPEPVTLGGTLTYTVWVTNAGPDVAVGTEVDGQLSNGAGLVSVQSSQGDCSFANGALLCGLGNLDAGQVASVILKVTPQVGGPLTNSFSVTARSTDSSPANDAFRLFTTVNSPPVLPRLSDQTTLEDTPIGPLSIFVNDLETDPNDLILTARSSNTNLLPAGDLVLGGAGTNRTLNLVPAPDQFGISLITVTAGDGIASVSQSIHFTVIPVNDPPQLERVPDQVLWEGGTLTVTNRAFDVDLPANKLTFSLSAGPVPAVVDSVTGELTWTPGTNQTVGVYPFTIEVTDDGTPPLSGLTTFSVTLLGRPFIESILPGNGEVVIAWRSVPNQVYRVQSSEEAAGPNWLDVSGDVVATGPSASKAVPMIGRQRFYRLIVSP
jgi:uncharacterized repeat protein (TIGR01451 family)